MFLDSKLLDRVLSPISPCSFFFFFVGAGLSLARALPLQETMVRGLYSFTIS